jgi:hypothetical protein
VANCCVRQQLGVRRDDLLQLVVEPTVPIRVVVDLGLRLAVQHELRQQQVAGLPVPVLVDVADPLAVVEDVTDLQVPARVVPRHHTRGVLALEPVVEQRRVLLGVRLRLLLVELLLRLRLEPGVPAVALALDVAPGVPATGRRRQALVVDPAPDARAVPTRGAGRVLVRGVLRLREPDGPSESCILQGIHALGVVPATHGGAPVSVIGPTQSNNWDGCYGTNTRCGGSFRKVGASIHLPTDGARPGRVRPVVHSLWSNLCRTPPSESPRGERSRCYR